MDTLNKLMAHMRARPLELAELRRQGAKIIGYVLNGYLPEELLYASGAIPVGLMRGGDHEPVIRSEACLLRFVDTFCRSHIGYRLLGEELLYQLPDLLVVANTDRNMFAIGEMWQHYTDVPVLKMDVPRYNRADHAFEYYVSGLRNIKKSLEEFTGHEITDETLKHEIEVSNEIRSLLQQISYTRKKIIPPITGKDFTRLNHATFYSDREVLVDALQTIAAELKTRTVNKQKSPRILLTGSTLAEGDYKVLDLLEQSGAAVVIEEFAEGVRHYREKVELQPDLIVALADRYLRRQPPPAFFKLVVKERFKYLLNLIKEFNVDGVVWYCLMYRDCYDKEGVLFQSALEKEVGIPFLKVHSDYDVAETGPMRTRIEAFIETSNQRR